MKTTWVDVELLRYPFFRSLSIESAWKLVQEFADDVTNSISVAPIKRRFNRPMPSRFSFTRSVSREVYEQQLKSPNLTDGCTPIYVLETNELLDELAKETRRKERARKANIELNSLTDDVSN